MRGRQCQKCGTTGNGDEIHKHHSLPIRLGGSDHPDNLVPLCRSCHSEAHWHLFEEFGEPEDRAAALGLGGNITEMQQLLMDLGRQKAQDKKRWLLENDDQYCQWHKQHCKELHSQIKERYNNDPAYREQHLQKCRKGAEASKISRTGKVWITNKTSNKLISPGGTVPEGWELGLTHETKPGAHGYMWITDGSSSTMIPKEDPVPEGWNKGRTTGGTK